MARSILSTIMRVESGGRNIPQSIHDINTERGTPAQGYFQIIDPTWAQFGGDKTGFKSAIHAPYEVQRQIALNIPVSHWGPATQDALRAAGYEPKSGETLAQLLQRYGEDPNAATPADGGAGVPTADTAVASASPPGLLASNQLTQQQIALLMQAQADAKKAKDEDDMLKQGTGLLGQATTPAPQMAPLQTNIHRPQMAQAQQPDFSQILAQQRLMRRA